MFSRNHRLLRSTCCTSGGRSIGKPCLASSTSQSFLSPFDEQVTLGDARRLHSGIAL